MNIRDLFSNRKTKMCLFGEVTEVVPVAEKILRYFDDISFLTVYREEEKLQSLKKYGISSILYDIEDIRDLGYIIICAKYNFSDLARLLKCAGLKPYDDYVSALALDAYVNNKKLFVGMGNELIEQLMGALSLQKKYTDSYSVVYFPQREFWRDMRDEYIHVSRLADVHVESVTNDSKSKIYRLPQDVLKRECVVIRIPDFGFRGVFPQIYYDNEIYNPLMFRKYERDDDIDYETVFASKIDLFAECLCEKVGEYSEDDVQRIALKLLDENLVNEEKLKNFYIKESEYWKKLEEKYEIDIAIRNIFDYEIDNICVNHNTLEWSDRIVNKLMRYIFDKTGVSKDCKIENDNILCTYGTELPIYPCVQKALGLKEQLKDKKYKIITFNGVRYLNISEYVEHIVRYTLSTLELYRYTESDKKKLADCANGIITYRDYCDEKKKISSIDDWLDINTWVKYD